MFELQNLSKYLRRIQAVLPETNGSGPTRRLARPHAGSANRPVYGTSRHIDAYSLLTGRFSARLTIKRSVIIPASPERPV